MMSKPYLIAAGLHSGCAIFSNTAIPLTCGQAIDVPHLILNSTRRVSFSNPEGLALPLQPARIFTPGAMMSGLSRCCAFGFGPLPLNAATIGDGWTPNLVPSNEIVASEL
ncbi:hypothetical protein HanXRQr2_Chr09g0403891 [Helianthus annuus]|uniref:Uncharacterized protein n=1 Tax=Helianthus annuus TaxID=4232 RepID=A0A9K3I973_HELAN|nr:hypothetical protein HanXRQr2_Chr09g0403891 [Helianthus annuus]KAJ0894509.1 hypothetical protein HanPSC8_Chr09g0389811 [Helianthus annuus]